MNKLSDKALKEKAHNLINNQVGSICQYDDVMEGLIEALNAKDKEIAELKTSIKCTQNNSDDRLRWAKEERDKVIELEKELQKYNELIMAVQNKWPNQTCHETALKYIMQAENSDNCCAKEAKLEGESE